MANLKNAEIAMQDLKIVADFSWEISNVFVENWTRVWVWTKLISVSNNSKFKIIAFLSKAQISWINVWDKILIWKKSVDKIYSISSVSDSLTKKYKVEILHENPFLSAWEFINIKFTREKVSWKNKILLPLPWVFISERWDYVWVVKNISEKNISWETKNIWEIKKTKVKVWGLSWNDIEILEWLNIWDVVVSWWWRFLKKDWDKVILD